MAARRDVERVRLPCNDYRLPCNDYQSASVCAVLRVRVEMQEKKKKCTGKAGLGPLESEAVDAGEADG